MAAQAPAGTIYLRKVVEVPAAKVVAARFQFIVDDELTLWVNGTESGSARTGMRVTAWDVARHLKPGKNVLAIAAKNTGGSAGVIGKLDIQFALSGDADRTAAFEGKTAAGTVSAPIDATWKCAATAPAGWQKAAFDDKAWNGAVEIAAMADAPWGRPPAVQTGNVDLLPKPSEIHDPGDTVFGADGDALTVSMKNPGGERWNVHSLPLWYRRLDMTQRRGIGAYVTGDGSGADLVFRIPGRDYVMHIDFKGRRYVEIPLGEVSWADGRWGWRVATHRANYAGVERMRIGFGRVRAKTHPTVRIEALRALQEIPAELSDPVIRIDGGALHVTGKVRSGEYLQYDGQRAVVYDRNWNRLRTLRVRPAKFTMPAGAADVSIETAGKGPAPWLAVQFMTEGKPITVRK